jgi:hypothetical protein
MSSASEKAPTTSNVFTFIGFSFGGVAQFQTLPPQMIACSKHGTHSAPLGAVRIRTVVEHQRLVIGVSALKAPIDFYIPSNALRQNLCKTEIHQATGGQADRRRSAKPPLGLLAGASILGEFGR